MKLSDLHIMSENHKANNPLADLEFVSSKFHIPLSVIGGVAVDHYGYKRFTEDVGILVRRTQVDELAHSLMSLGFESIGNNKLKKGTWIVNICAEGVKAGSVVFPPPESKSGVEYASLPLLISLKIRANRYKDRTDVVELFKKNKLPAEFLETVPDLNKMQKMSLNNLYKIAIKESV